MLLKYVARVIMPIIMIPKTIQNAYGKFIIGVPCVFMLKSAAIKIKGKVRNESAVKVFITVLIFRFIN